MCGIFGMISPREIDKNNFKKLVTHSQQRGKDSSGLLCYQGGTYHAYRADYQITRLLSEIRPYSSPVVMGHSRLITNGMVDNQPVIRDGICALHNGIIVNHEAIWPEIGKEPRLQIDTELIIGIASAHLESGGDLAELPVNILKLCQGVVACALILPKYGKICLFSNNGSLYVGEYGQGTVFASESFPLCEIGCEEIRQVKGKAVFLDIPVSDNDIKIQDKLARTSNLIPALKFSSSEEKKLIYRRHDLRRCTRCVLPETMPFINFDADGVCNYCRSYKPRNVPRSTDEIFDLVEPYRRQMGNDCIVPFSGGRDSCYGLHLIVNELKMQPVTYTYDWGMVTDLGRRNISRLCADLGVENIIIADDIAKKRRNIKMNLKAWLRSPDLGMVSILTAGDKHFFRHVESVKKQTGIKLNLWGVNPLEVTHFKAGFLGVPPDFEEKRVYNHGWQKQLNYQKLRFKAMLKSPGYFNRSLWDTLSGEYYRSFTQKEDYFHIYDYWRWDEKKIDAVLDMYNWEKAPDTKTTWRIGDGTAAFYNYIYYTVAGFTEHDTFRSNQIREGDLTREEALELVIDENTPRYPNIKWYLDAVGLEFDDVISVINSIESYY